MFRSWHLGRPFGINLFVHWTFWLLPLWVILSHRVRDPMSLTLELGLIFALFGCVVLHELGHALTARRFGIETRSIVLSPIGGVASFDRPIRGAWQEFCIALAGPLVNVAIALGLGGFLAVVGGLDPYELRTWAGEFLFLLLSLNITMVVFNLIPAFPMDGGRVLRALLAGSMGVLRATRIAVTIGTVMAVLIALFGLFSPYGSPWLLAIAAFVFFAGRAELAQLEMREHFGRGHPVEPGLDDGLATVRPVRSTPLWSRAAQVVYVWDAVRGKWIREERPAST